MFKFLMFLKLAFHITHKIIIEFGKLDIKFIWNIQTQLNDYKALKT